MASIFTQIINGNIPAHKIYEDEYSFAFLDIHPLREGHTLVVSKREVTQFHQLSEDEYAGLSRAVHRIANKIDATLSPKRVVQLAHSYGVEHVHIHLLPTNTYGDLKQAIIDHELVDMNSEPDHEALAAMAEMLVL
jgi:histidine triad (HIT) family protein